MTKIVQVPVKAGMNQPKKSGKRLQKTRDISPEKEGEVTCLKAVLIGGRAHRLVRW